MPREYGRESRSRTSINILVSSGCSRYWSRWRDSNSRPSGPKPDALPDCATPSKNFARPCLLTTRRLRQTIYLLMSFLELQNQGFDYHSISSRISFEFVTVMLSERRGLFLNPYIYSITN